MTAVKSNVWIVVYRGIIRVQEILGIDTKEPMNATLLIEGEVDYYCIIDIVEVDYYASLG